MPPHRAAFLKFKSSIHCIFPSIDWQRIIKIWNICSRCLATRSLSKRRGPHLFDPDMWCRFGTVHAILLPVARLLPISMVGIGTHSSRNSCANSVQQYACQSYANIYNSNAFAFRTQNSTIFYHLSDCWCLDRTQRYTLNCKWRFTWTLALNSWWTKSMGWFWRVASARRHYFLQHLEVSTESRNGAARRGLIKLSKWTDLHD